jgi:Flp pilus assembly protein TadG
MMRRAFSKAKLASDAQGSVAVEFAILAPVLFAMIFGVLTMGLHQFSANALQSAASDTARWAVIEYQKDNKVSATQVSNKARAIVITPPYGLDTDRLEVSATTVTTDIAGTTKFKLDMTYNPYNPIEFAGVGSPPLGTTRYFYVAS